MELAELMGRAGAACGASSWGRVVAAGVLEFVPVASGVAVELASDAAVGGAVWGGLADVSEVLSSDFDEDEEDDDLFFDDEDEDDEGGGEGFEDDADEFEDEDEESEDSGGGDDDDDL